MPARTILLTGASWRIGRCLREALRGDYWLVRSNRSEIPDLGPTERLVRGDTTDAAALEAAARGDSPAPARASERSGR